MIAGTLHFNGRMGPSLKIGSEFLVPLNFYDADRETVDISYYSFRMQVRDSSGRNVILELSSLNGRIYLDSNMTLYLNVPHEETLLLKPGRYVYDLELTDLDSGRVDTLVEGEFHIKGEVTR